MPRTLLLLPLLTPLCCSPSWSKPDPDHLLLILVVKKMGARRPQPAAPQANAADEACRWAKGCWQSQWGSQVTIPSTSLPLLSLSVSLSRRAILISFALCTTWNVLPRDLLGEQGQQLRGRGGGAGQRWHNTHTHTTHSFSHSVWGNAHFWVRSSQPQWSCHFRLGGLLIVPTDICHIRKSIKIKRAAAEGGRGTTM